MKPQIFSLIISIFIVLQATSTAAQKIGVCYGRVADNLPPISQVINLLKSNGLTKVRLFDTDPSFLQAFSGTGSDLMIGIPNQMLPSLAGDLAAAIGYLQNNIFPFISSDQIQYIAAGNEVFFNDPYYPPFLVPALQNLQQALKTLNITRTIKISSPVAASVLSSSFPPSSSSFNPEILPLMLPFLQFLTENGSPLMINVYPFLSYINNPVDISLNYALFDSPPAFSDGGLVYDNLFDATIDSFYAATEVAGFSGIPVMVTETGWPSKGNSAASPANALAYNRNVVKRTLDGFGTPKRPGVAVDVYLFGLFNEDEKVGEEYERNFGIFYPNGVKVYNLSFVMTP